MARSSTTSPAARADQPTQRLILIYGNCQAHWLGGVLAAQGAGLVAIVGSPFGFYPELHGVRPFFVTPEEASQMAMSAKLAGCQVALLEQTSPLHPGLDADTQRLGSHVVRFPHLEVRAYWHPWLTRAGDGFSHERIRRQFEFDLAAMRRSCAKAGWNGDLVDHVVQSHQTSLHFHTLNHPSADLMQRLHGGVCDALESRGGIDPYGREWAQAEIETAGGMGFIAEHPLHDAAIDALDLRWARQGWYADWQRAYFAAGDGDDDQARQLLEAALADPAHDPHVNYTYGQLLEKLGEMAAATEAFGRAHRAYPQNPEYGRRWLNGFTTPERGEHPLLARLNESFPG